MRSEVGLRHGGRVVLREGKFIWKTNQQGNLTRELVESR